MDENDSNIITGKHCATWVELTCDFILMNCIANSKLTLKQSLFAVLAFTLTHTAVDYMSYMITHFILVTRSQRD